jgi:hypothetical protein
MQYKYLSKLKKFWIQDNFLKFHAATDTKSEKILEHKVEADTHNAVSPRKEVEMQQNRESKANSQRNNI